MSTDTLERTAQLQAAAGLHARKPPPNISSPSGSGRDVARSQAFEVHERWEGRVEEVCETYFQATIENLLTGKRASARIITMLVSPGDRELLTPGSLFFWHIGIRTKVGGEREQVSTLRFRRGLRERSVPERAVKFWLGVDDEGDG